MKNPFNKTAALAAILGVGLARADGLPQGMTNLPNPPPPPAIAGPAVASVPMEATIEQRAARARESAAQQKSVEPPAELVRVMYPSDPTDRSQPPEAGAIYGFVPPERTVAVTISRRDVNRIHCDTDIADVFYSKEKPMSVSVAGTDVFVKVLKKVVNGQHESWDQTPLDLHVVCGDAVYTMILQPVDLDSVTLRLGDPHKKKLIDIAKQWGALPIEEKVQRLTRMVYRDELPATFAKASMTTDRLTPRMFRNLVIQGVNRVTAPGLGLAALEYEIIADGEVKLDERDFLNVGLSKTIVGITIDPLVINEKNRKARLIIIERSLSDGR